MIDLFNIFKDYPDMRLELVGKLRGCISVDIDYFILFFWVGNNNRDWKKYGGGWE